MGDREIDDQTQTMVEGLRSEEQWERYDSYIVGPDAQRRSVTWDNNFAAMAGRDLLTFFSGDRTKSVGKSYADISGGTEDWSHLVYQAGIEFIAPTGYLSQVVNASDATFFPAWWVTELPHKMSATIKLQDTDEVLLVPLSHMPGGTGTSGVVMDSMGSATVAPGQTGPGSLTMTWTFPKPLAIPSKKKFIMEVTIDSPMKEMMLALPDNIPGTAQVVNTDAAGNVVVTPRKLWYQIRVWLRGPRKVQLRSAYSA